MHEVDAQAEAIAVCMSVFSPLSSKNFLMKQDHPQQTARYAEWKHKVHRTIINSYFSLYIQ